MCKSRDLYKSVMNIIPAVSFVDCLIINLLARVSKFGHLYSTVQSTCAKEEQEEHLWFGTLSPGQRKSVGQKPHPKILYQRPRGSTKEALTDDLELRISRTNVKIHLTPTGLRLLRPLTRVWA
jgi:hypothetical protein